MFNVIRIPTKFSKTIKRLSNEERLEVFDLLIKIGDGGEISPPDSMVGDVVQLIYGEWMNMEAKNGNKQEKSSINLCSGLPGEVRPGMPDSRVEYSRVEENRIEDNIVDYNSDPKNTEHNEIPDTKFNKKEWEDFSKQEGFASYAASRLLIRKWKPDETIEEFSEWISEFMKIKNIKYNEGDFLKWKGAFQSMFSYWDEIDKGSRKRKIWKSRMLNQKGFNFNLK